MCSRKLGNKALFPIMRVSGSKSSGCGHQFSEGAARLNLAGKAGQSGGVARGQALSQDTGKKAESPPQFDPARRREMAPIGSQVLRTVLSRISGQTAREQAFFGGRKTSLLGNRSRQGNDLGTLAAGGANFSGRFTENDLLRRRDGYGGRGERPRLDKPCAGSLASTGPRSRERGESASMESTRRESRRFNGAALT